MVNLFRYKLWHFNFSNAQNVFIKQTEYFDEDYQKNAVNIFWDTEQ